MAGSHRAPLPPRRARGPVVALVAVVLVLAAIAGGYALNRSGDDKTRGAGPSSSTPTTTASTGTPSPAPSPSSSAASPTSSPTASPSHRPTAKPLPRVQASAPKRMVVSGVLDIGFDSTVEPKDGVLVPRSTAEVARWGGRGVPGSPSRDTVFIVGKVSPGGAFERLPRLRRGTEVLLRTQSGRLTYTVQAIAERREAGLTRDLAFAKRVPGRLQLVGIRYDATGDRTGRVLVVTAVLTAARAGG